MAGSTATVAERAKSFGAYAVSYDKFRPDYPAEAIGAIVDAAARARPEDVAAGGLTVCDLACGTGKASFQYVKERGVRRVICADHDEGMLEQCRAVAEETEGVAADGGGGGGGGGVQVSVQVGSAESTGLPDACCSLVAGHMAFHWFDCSRAMPEIHRVVRPGGLVAAVWYVRGRCSGSRLGERDHS